MKIDPNAPAYPVVEPSRMIDVPPYGGRIPTGPMLHPGMSIRAAMATQILAGIYAGCTSRDVKGCPDINTMNAIDEAIGTADALIAALNGEKP